MRQLNHMYGGIGAAWGATLPILALMLVIPALACTDSGCGSSLGGSAGAANGWSGVPSPYGSVGGGT